MQPVLRRLAEWMRPALLLLAGAPTVSPAAEMWGSYNAGRTVQAVGEPPQVLYPPEFAGEWLYFNLENAGSPVINSNSTGLNAWRLTDPATAILSPRYYTNFNSRLTQSRQHGWRLQTVARYVEHLAGGANMGLTVYFDGREYDLMLKLAPSGDLQATLHDEQPQVYTLPTGAAGTAVFHNFALTNQPGTQLVSFQFDGVPFGVNWDGVQAVPGHANIAQWGNSQRAGAARGTMDFNEVQFAIGPIADLAGDYDRSSIVDGTDFLSWQATVGSTTNLLADGNHDGKVDAGDLVPWSQNLGTYQTTSAGVPVPEPATVGLAVCFFAACGMARRRAIGAFAH